eukprot:CAMPEP_0198331734 /NCGR_PEP_ID=MMETSP1450-20131203/17793_1 /TAXON_ID=753684 ORGANISM="Madagascaria erythrocladiodes, Strain CCMP3234" /NCGR_SAMPLE_ID=MMETSP1450 /ASSEMBLY_ACC=CAM_ASM_001115 /LENGTH=131 /DNA_ID=CAMNT_0044036143 /DNA_START=12 /DNA_END=403 /DNA_ORIENTATION=-
MANGDDGGVLAEQVERLQFSSIKELAECATLPDVNPNTRARLYCSSALRLYLQADTYFVEHNYEYAYMMFLKYADLVMDRLPKHPQYGEASLAPKRKELRDKLAVAIGKMESIKSKLKALYDAKQAAADAV